MTVRPSRLVALLAALALALAGCVPGDAAPGAATALRAAADSAAPPAPGGAFVVHFPPVDDPALATLRAEMEESRFLHDVAEWLNGWIALPEDVALTFESCGEANAFYDPETRAIALCYELLDDLDRVFADQESEEAATQAVTDALLFTTLHEVGHALVDVLELPVTGREEDAVDQLAALMLADGSEEGNAAAVHGIIALSGDEEELDDLAFADQHGLGAQRFYNVVCLVYGQDPDAGAGWVEEGWLPEARAEGCAEEYAQVSGAWDRLLAGYLRN